MGAAQQEGSLERLLLGYLQEQHSTHHLLLVPVVVVVVLLLLLLLDAAAAGCGGGLERGTTLTAEIGRALRQRFAFPRTCGADREIQLEGASSAAPRRDRDEPSTPVLVQ